MSDTIVKWPFGAASGMALTASGVQEIKIVNDLTIIDGTTVPATGDRTLNISVSDTVSAGAMILVKSKTIATEKTVFGEKITGPEITGVAGKTKVATFVYDGSDFIQTGTAVEID